MKTYSFILICLTLGLFYSLAVKMEHDRKLENMSALHSADIIEKTDLQSHASNKCYSNDIVILTSDKLPSNHLGLHDDFSLQVTGKQHKYLNTGVSFIQIQDSKNEPKNNVTSLSGS